MNCNEWMQACRAQGVQALVFDMDGTLLDTEQVIVESASAVLQHYGHAPLPVGYHMPNMFGTAADLMYDVMAERGLPVPAGSRAEIGQCFEHYYAQQPAGIAPLYAGVREFLQAAHANGMALGVCTNKQYALAVKGLQAAGMADWMGCITGRDSCSVFKPSPVPLLHTLQVLGMAPKQALYFGDTHVDAQCAQAAEVPFAWFSGGFGTSRVQEFAQALHFASWQEVPPYQPARSS